MKRWVLFMLVAAMATGVATAQTVVNTAHDLSAGSGGATSDAIRVCVFCHTPHASQVQTDPGTNVLPLWNHNPSVAGPYLMYDSTTMQAVPTDFSAPANLDATTVSNLCMSCHDGSVAVTSLFNDPNEIGADPTIVAGGNVDAGGLIINEPNLGTDLTNDHPVNFDYDNALFIADGGGLNDPAGAPVTALLSGGTVQCSSCHDPHDNTNPGGPFMVVDNTDSALCTTCHAK